MWKASQRRTILRYTLEYVAYSVHKPSFLPFTMNPAFLYDGIILVCPIDVGLCHVNFVHSEI